jgi:putative ABC transport system substrate-binding protein
VRRREFISLIGGAVAAWPVAARAQQAERVRKVGVLMNSAATDATYQSYLAAFTEALHQLGWIEGQNLRIDVRWSAGDAALARIYAAQLIGLKPDVILTSSTNNLKALREATSTIPVVFVQVSDPVAQGFVANITKPGGNITGFSMYEFAIGSKWLNLLKEVAPGLARVALMFNPEASPQSQFFMRSIEAAAPSLGVQPVAVPVRATADIEAAREFRTPAERRADPADRQLHLATLPADRGAGGSPSPTVDLRTTPIRQGGRPDVVWGGRD